MATIQCVCPPRADGEPRHPGGDTVTLKEKLDFRSAVQARNAIIILKQDDEKADVADILASLTEVYVLVGVESWTLLDARNKPVEVNRANLRAFMADHPLEAMDVGNEADNLYSAAVIAPLLAQASKSSPPTQIDDSTSQTTGSSPTRRKPSKPSLITSSPMVATERMSASPGGVFS